MRTHALLLIALLLVSGCASGASPAGATAIAKLLVTEDGIQQVDAAALRAAGFDLSGARQEQLRLEGRDGPLALQLLPGNRGIRFYARGPAAEGDAPFRAFRLTRLEGATAAAIAGEVGSLRSPERPAAVEPASIVRYAAVAEQARRYDARAEAYSDRWMWKALLAPATFDTAVEVIDPAPGPAQLTVRLLGQSDPRGSPDHHASIEINGTAVADARWDGTGEHEITAVLPPGLLIPGPNTVTVRLPGDSGAPVDAVQLDRIALSYPRRLAATGGPWEFEGSDPAYRVAAPGRQAPLVWDITDPAAPHVVSDAGHAGGQFTFAAGSGRRFAIAPQGALARPEVAPVQPSSLPDWPGGADWIAITTPELRSALEPLVEYRRAQGLRVAVLEIEEVYDAFSSGEPDPEAIRALTRHAVASWPGPPPKYLLLGGDAGFDPRGFMSGAEKVLIPSLQVKTEYSGWTGSDVSFGLGEDGATPVVAVGRLPAQTREQLAAMVDKILAMERAPGSSTRLAHLVADNEEEAFRSEAEAFASLLEGYDARVETVDGDGAAARQRLIDAFAGASLVGYFGHGAVDLWADEKILTGADVPSLGRTDQLPLVFTVTCLSGFFEHPGQASLGERLLREPERGASAAFLPSSAELLTHQAPLAQALAQALAERQREGTIGEAFLDAAGRLPAAARESGGSRWVLLTTNLFGDPAMRVP